MSNLDEENDPKDIPVIKTYVFFKDKCFFVSTIDRRSSSIYGGRYNETLTWEHDWAAGVRGKLIWDFQESDLVGSIRAHLRVVESLYEYGIYKPLK